MDLTFDNCPFCNEVTIFKRNGSGYVCGCQTLGCRGNHIHAPTYQSFKTMHNQWNRRDFTKIFVSTLTNIVDNHIANINTKMVNLN